MKSLSIILLVLTVNVAFAQDQLFKKDNTKLEVKIIEINPTEIKYKLFNYQTGPTITINKSDIVLIVYQNGEHEVMIQSLQPAVNNIYYNSSVDYKNSLKSQERDSLFKDYTSTKHVISTNLLEVLNGGFNVSYFTELAKNNLNIYLPFTVGFTEPVITQSNLQNFSNNNTYQYYDGGNISDFRFTRKVAEGGIGLHFQASNTRLVTYFIGPYFSLAQFNGTFMGVDYTQTYNPNYGNYTYNYTHTLRSFVMNRASYMLDNGILFRMNKHFNALLILGIGAKSDYFVSKAPSSYYTSPSYNYYSNTHRITTTAARLNFSLGYRF